MLEGVMMDEIFSVFLETYSNVVAVQAVPVSSIERYRGKLPDLLLTCWERHGWGGYGNGIFWLVNPQEYEGVVSSWLAGTELEQVDDFHVVAMGAFGNLYLWGEKTGQSLTIECCLSHYDFEKQDVVMPDKEVQLFFLSREVETDDFDDLFESARKRLGNLQCGEMYGFVPAIMLGGSGRLSQLEKVKAVEHLILLSQLAKLTPWGFSELEAQLDK